MATRIQVRRDLAANWTSNNPTLASGEIGLETDTRKWKIGNGSSNWTSLEYQLPSMTGSWASTPDENVLQIDRSTKRVGINAASLLHALDVGGTFRATGNSTIGGTLTVAGALAVTGTVTSTGVISGPGVIPIGGIIMWNGSSASIPSNWQLCDGSNGTPDLRNKFILGGNAYSTSAWRESITGSALSTGGNKDSIAVSHTHSFSGTADSAGAHTHTVTGSTSSNGAHTHTTSLNFNAVGLTGTFASLASLQTGTTQTPTTSSAGAHTHTVSGTAASDGAHSHTLTGSIASAGASGTNANLPPFFVLAFIQRMT